MIWMLISYKKSVKAGSIPFSLEMLWEGVNLNKYYIFFVTVLHLVKFTFILQFMMLVSALGHCLSRLT